MIDRRAFLQSAALAVSGSLLTTGASAQQPPASGVTDTSNLFAMDQSAARTVRMPPKPGALPSMAPDQRDALEHKIRCQCGCTLDVYTCRTTDFSCQVSPAMHRDVLALVEGGYTAAEILEAFVNTYGEQALMAPPKQGFNLVGYLLPGTAIAIGAVVLAIILRQWRRPASATPTTAARPDVDAASPDELRRLDAAIRDDS